MQRRPVAVLARNHFGAIDHVDGDWRDNQSEQRHEISDVPVDSGCVVWDASEHTTKRELGAAFATQDVSAVCDADGFRLVGEEASHNVPRGGESCVQRHRGLLHWSARDVGRDAAKHDFRVGRDVDGDVAPKHRHLVRCIEGVPSDTAAMHHVGLYHSRDLECDVEHSVGKVQNAVRRSNHATNVSLFSIDLVLHFDETGEQTRVDHSDITLSKQDSSRELIHLQVVVLQLNGDVLEIDVLDLQEVRLAKHSDVHLAVLLHVHHLALQVLMIYHKILDRVALAVNGANETEWFVVDYVWEV